VHTLAYVVTAAASFSARLVTIDEIVSLPERAARSPAGS
jgi:hypothetical protein